MPYMWYLPANACGPRIPFRSPSGPLPAPSVEQSERTTSFRLLSLDALVRMKLTSFRDKDRMHVRDLIGVSLVDPGWLERLPNPLAERLRTLLDNPGG